MERGPLLPPQISAALASGATVLTGNQRAARTLRNAFNSDRAAAGERRWAPPPIVAWETWTQDLWRFLLRSGRRTELLLNRVQEHAIWCSILAADETLGGLVTVDRLAGMAAQTWSRLSAYMGEHRLRTPAASVDARAFQSWTRSLHERSRAEGFLVKARLESTLAEAFRDKMLAPAAGGYALVGFDAMTPARQTLMDALRDAGGSVEALQTTAPGTEPKLVAAQSAGDELQTAARWIKQHLDAHRRARVALIVPSLQEQRPEIDRVLRSVLHPRCEEPDSPGFTPRFEFSLGLPLAQTPMAACALILLHGAINPLSFERISRLLLSPWFAYGQEIAARATLDACELRHARLLRPEASLDRLHHLAESSRRRRELPGLLRALAAMRRTIQAEEIASNVPRSHADWAEAFRHLLEAAGWGQGMDSIAYQTRQRWEDLLDELTTLDFQGLRVSYTEALAVLERLAGEALFAPESQDAPLQVMGVLESAGSVFDAAWFLGAGDLQWPIPTAASPLLSWTLQRELGMPGTRSPQETRDNEHLACRIAGCAPAVIFSYAQDLPEGKQRPSPALSVLRLEPISPEELLPAPPSREIVALESIDDSASLPPVPDRVLRGGATILKLQAACGFRAFAEQRLRATAPNPAEAGMDARQRGEMVHKALEHFWTRVRTQDALKALSTTARHALLSESIEAALAKTAAANAGVWDAAYIDVQCERLLILLDTWLLTEMRREVPFLVKVSELELNDVRIGPLRLDLRVDRIDQTEFGEVILDYKTGLASPSAWLGDRPEEPQLPLYAVLTASAPLAGVGFGQVRAGKEVSLHGYQTTGGLLLKKAKLTLPTLDDQVEAWREVLTKLAEDFHRGDVRVRPKAYPHTCQHCEQRLLCRLDVTLLAPDALDDAREDETDTNDG